MRLGPCVPYSQEPLQMDPHDADRVTDMMLFAASTDQVPASSDPLGILVLGMLLVAIGGLLALGMRQRRTAEQELDLEWLPLDE